ncbi:MAG: hypothetical protein NTY53_08065, partial [Kiritimatiellaeota bacterium]|nr:hypothetical protein [Kiritimatiellota bacterium]
MQHRISAVLTPADKAAIIAKLNEIRALVPFLISLSPRERQSLTKLGNKTASFDGKCRDYMAQHPKLVPRFLDMAEFQR